jgi:hypothetical protein
MRMLCHMEYTCMKFHEAQMSAVCLVLVLGRRRPARLEHALHAVSPTHHTHGRGTYLHHLKLHAASRLAVGDREERRERRVTHDRRERVAVLVREPVPASAR